LSGHRAPNRQRTCPRPGTCGMSDFGTELARLMAARGLGVRELARMVPCNPGHISNLRSGKARPSPELAGILDDRLAAGGTLAALAPEPAPRRPHPAATAECGLRSAGSGARTAS